MDCSNEEKSIGVKSHFDNDVAKINEIIMTKRFKKDAPEFDVEEVISCEHLHFTRLHKFEKHVGDLHIFRALIKGIHYLYAVDKKYRVIFLRAFKNFKEYGKFLDSDREILREVEVYTGQK